MREFTFLTINYHILSVMAEIQTSLTMTRIDLTLIPYQCGCVLFCEPQKWNQMISAPQFYVKGKGFSLRYGIQKQCQLPVKAREVLTVIWCCGYSVCWPWHSWHIVYLLSTLNNVRFLHRCFWACHNLCIFGTVNIYRIQMNKLFISWGWLRFLLDRTRDTVCDRWKPEKPVKFLNHSLDNPLFLKLFI